MDLQKDLTFGVLFLYWAQDKISKSHSKDRCETHIVLKQLPVLLLFPTLVAHTFPALLVKPDSNSWNTNFAITCTVKFSNRWRNRLLLLVSSVWSKCSFLVRGTRVISHKQNEYLARKWANSIILVREWTWSACLGGK